MNFRGFLIFFIGGVLPLQRMQKFIVKILHKYLFADYQFTGRYVYFLLSKDVHCMTIPEKRSFIF